MNRMILLVLVLFVVSCASSVKLDQGACPPGTQLVSVTPSATAFLRRQGRDFDECAARSSRLEALSCQLRLIEGSYRQFCSLPEGRLDGPALLVSPFSAPLVHQQYDNGKLHGLQLEWYANGQLRREAVRSHGVLCGIYRAWDRDGSPSEEGAYRDGKKHGLWIEYLEGRKQAPKEYRDGRLMSSIGPDRRRCAHPGCADRCGR